MRRWLTLVSLLLLLPGLAEAATYYVNSTLGSNSNSCATATSNGASAKANFWGSTGALACLNAGDTLKVAPNMTYAVTPQGASVFNGSGGTSASRITIESETTGQKWTLSKTTAGSATFYFDGDSYVTMRDFIIDHNKTNGTPILLRGASTNNVFEDCEIREVGNASGITMDVIEAASNTVRRCTIYDVGSDDPGTPQRENQYHAVYIESANNLVEHSTFHSLYGYGIHIYSSSNGSTQFSNNIVRYNEVYDSTSCIQVASTSQRVYRNLCYDNVNAGIQIRYNTAGGSVIEQNTIARTSGGPCMQVETSSSRPATVIKNNICFSNSNNTINILSTSTGTITDQDNLLTTSSSHFVSAATDDFNLAAGSSAIDGGTTATYSSCNGTCDQGAFEAPVFASCSVEDGDATKVRVLFTTNAGGALQGSAAAQWAAVVAGAGASETAVTLVGTTRLDVTLSAAVTNGQSVTIAYTAGTLTDSLAIGNTRHATVRSFTAQSCTNNVGAAPTATFRQIAFGWYEYYGTEAAGATVFACGENTNCDFFQYARVALRLKMDCNGGNCDPKTVTARYSKNGGAYTEIPNTVGADKILFTACPNMAHGSATTERLISGAGGFVAGMVIGQLVAIPNIDLAQNDETEFVFCLGWTDATIADTYDFRFYDQAGTAIDTYSVTPRATIGYPATLLRTP